MKVAILVVGALLFSGWAAGQNAGSSAKDQGIRPDPAVASKDIVPLPSIKTLTPEQAAGKKLFVQRCSVCHLPALPSYTAYGPLLDSRIVSSWGDDAIRQRIQNGSVKMPGFQYTLSGDEIEKIIVYLKTLDFANKD